MNKEKRLFLIILTLITVATLVCVVAACSGGGNNTDEDIEPDDVPTIKKLTQNEALDKIYDGLLDGKTEMSSAKTYGVSNELVVYIQTVLNYSVTYKANYRENAADSEIYVRLFDNDKHIERLSMLYAGGDLYFEFDGQKNMISAFGSSMLFEAFFEGCRNLDFTDMFYDEKQIADIFNRNNGGMNLGVILEQNQIGYNKVGETGEAIELSGLDLTIVNDTLTFILDNAFRGIDEKFDLISNKFLGFKLSRLINTRFGQINAEKIEMMFSDGAVVDSAWRANGTLQGQNQQKFDITAEIAYNDGKAALTEKSSFVASDYAEANIGENRFVGEISIPSVSDQPFDMSIETELNTVNNDLNKLNVRILDASNVDFASLYYTAGTAYVNAEGFDEWLDGAVDIGAFNLPYVYLDNIDLSKLIAAGYNNLAKVLLVAVRNGFSYDGDDEKAQELYEEIIANFSDNGEDTIYFVVTEELIQKIRDDDETVMSIVARTIGIEEQQLASYIGEDFFSAAQFVIGYNLDSGELTLTMKHGEEVLFVASLIREDYSGVVIPTDCYPGSDKYAKINYPEMVTLQLEADLNLRSGKQATDINVALGAFVGDSSGKNTPYGLNNGQTLVVRGTVTQNIVNENIPNFVRFSVYVRQNNKETLVMEVCSNPKLPEELLVSYYAQMGDYVPQGDCLKYRLDRSVVVDSFGEVLGEDNIFAESNVLTILSTVMNLNGISHITKADGWFSFSLTADDEKDPVNELVGIKDTTASIKARAKFDDVDRDINAAGYAEPSVTPLESVTVESLYSEGSAWKTAVEVIINSQKITFVPTYSEESIAIETGKKVYRPEAKLFGELVSYELRITADDGTYRIAGLYDKHIVIDPVETTKLPTEIKVRYDNNVVGTLPCKIEGFDESNITLAGFNLAGFSDDEEAIANLPTYKLIIGVDSIMNIEYEVYVSVNNRTVLPCTDSNGNELYDNNNIPVVGVVNIDPYTYAMTRTENPSYNPIVDEIERQNMTLRYNNVYGEKQVIEGDAEVTEILKYDVWGVNKFLLTETDLDWEYDFDKITWQGSLGYAYATIGTEEGYQVRIAIKVIVSAQAFDYIKIDDESNGKYTIDFLQKDTYTIPSQSSQTHEVYLYFVTYDSAAESERKRKLVGTRPDGIEDEDYYKNYVLGSLEWEGAEELAKKPTVITVNGTSNLFGSLIGKDGNYTTAVFGETLCVGEQSVKLEICVPTRYQSSQNMQNETVATKCTVDDSGLPQFGDITSVQISPARFPKNDSFFAPFEINPYDSTARLPSTIYLKVAASNASGDGKFSDEAGNYVVKEYPVEWVTTDNKGNELNLIEQKEDGYYGLKNPVVYQQDFVVYGRVGDRDREDGANSGYIWVAMIVRNMASSLRDVRFEGLEEGQTSISIDPYKAYTLPTSFTAKLESGETVSEQNVQWSVATIDSDDWYPINYTDGYDAGYYDENGKYLFSYLGGNYRLRFVLEGSSDVIRQEIILTVVVAERKVVVNADGRNYVDIYNDGDFVYGYNKLNTYEEYSSTLYARLDELRSGGYISVAFDKAKGTDGSYTPYSLFVEWTTAEAGSADYEYSIDRLIDMLRTEPTGETVELKGKIFGGTVNEQTITVGFSFLKYTLTEISLERIYDALDSEAISVGEMDENGNISIADMLAGGMYINIVKAFGLKDDDGKFASPYDYIAYLFGELKLNFSNGKTMDVVPELTFDAYEGDAEGFNKKVLEGNALEQNLDVTETTIRLLRLSQGSALREISIILRVTKDVRLDDSETIVAELFDEKSSELFGENKDYALPKSIKVNYKYSGEVVYETDIWKVGETTIPYLKTEQATGIPVTLINTLRRDGSASQPSSYDFSFKLPCEDANYNITIRIPKKDINETSYSASDEAGLYIISGGELVINNPYLYYDADSEYGLDTSKVPNIITADITTDYESTEQNDHYVEWQFVKGVFDPSNFATGLDRVVLATAELKAYYDAAGNRQTQTVYLYVTVKSLVYYGISYGDLPISIGSDGNKNVITIDPYDDIMGYKGDFRLPTVGLTVLFNAGLDSYVFGDEASPVQFKLFDDNNNVLVEDLTNVPYTEKGHSLNYEALQGVQVLSIRAYIPGYKDGLQLYLDIQSRNIESVMIKNNAYDASGALVDEVSLESTYFIDPYNSATFGLPYEVSVKFRESADYTDQYVAGWELYDEETGTVSDLSSDKNFYSRDDASEELSYGFYNVTADSYCGKNYRLRGYISLGRTSTGIAGKQYFEIDAIVLNRSLKEEYATSYRYDDPLGGLLSDIPSELTENMFVDYDRYYAKLDLPDGYEYSAWSCPVIPYVNWSVENDDSVVDYKGGFDKSIVGNVYYGNTNIDALLKKVGDEKNAAYEQLIKARMWDGYFTSSGAPQAYSTQTSNKLRTLREEFDKEVYGATYELLLAEYNAGDETARQYANYLNNTLTNEIIAEYGYNRLTEYNDIIEKMYQKLKSAHEAEESGMKSAIFVGWQGVYDEFVAKNDEYNPVLSAYQLLKVAKYDEINDETKPVFTVDERNGINARLRARIESSLRIYINADIWDGVYDRALQGERRIMEALLNGTGTAAKSSALGVLRLYEALPGSVGEYASADISAPALDIGNIIDSYDSNGEPVYKTEFIFNVYSSISFISDIDVEIIYDYYPMLEKYIEEGIRLAVESVRESNKGEALTEYVSRVAAEYVSGIIPTTIEDDGTENKIIDFEYKYGEFGAEKAVYGDYWTTLYSYVTDKATEHIPLLSGNTDKEKWQSAYKTHELKKDGMCAVMEEIEENNADNYTKMLEEYAEVLRNRATAEMDGYYAAAVADANMIMADYIIDNNSKVKDITNSLGGAQGAFAVMFGTIADGIYDVLNASYTASDTRNEIVNAYNNINGGNGTSKAMAVYYLMKNTNVTTELKDRTENMFLAYLGGAAAYDTLLANHDDIGYTREEIDLLYAAAIGSDGVLNESKYNGAFSGAGDVITLDEYRKVAFVKSLKTVFSGSSDKLVTIEKWLDDAILAEYAKGYDKIVELDERYDTLRDNECGVSRKAFVKYIQAYEKKGQAVEEDIAERTEYYSEKNVFYNSKKIVERLLSATSFEYKNYLIVTDARRKELEMQAVEYYRDTYASAAVARTIDYAVYTYGDAAYASLIVRDELGEDFVEGIRNAYYYVLLNSALSSIKNNLTITDSDKQTNRYKNLSEEILKAFTIAAKGGTGELSLQQLAQYESVLSSQYLAIKYTTAIQAYTDILYDITYAGQNSVSGSVYAEIYEEGKLILDEIATATAKASGTFFSDVFKYMRQALVEDEAEFYYSAAEKVICEESRSDVYDGLDTFAFKTTDEETEAEQFFTKVKTGYDAMLADGKDKLAVIVGDLFDDGYDGSYYDRAKTILDIYAVLRKADDVDIEDAAQEMIAVIDSAVVVVATSDLDQAILSGIKTAIGQHIYNDSARLDKYGLTVKEAIDDDIVSVIEAEVFGVYLTLIKEINAERQKLNEAYLTDENIDGDYTVVGKSYAAAYVDILTTLLYNGVDGRRLESAYYIVTAKTTANEKAIKAAFDAGDYSEYGDALIEKMLLTSAHEDINAGEEALTVEEYIASKTSYVDNNILKRYTDLATGSDDNERKESIINAMSAKYVENVVFKAEDRAETEDDKRRVIAFDKSQLTASAGAAVKSPVYVGNGYKISDDYENAYKIDSIDYRYIQIQIKYVDFTDSTTVDTISSYADKNYIEIDPFAPEFPEEVHAYGEYQATGSTEKVLFDVGYVAVSYDDVFYENIYDGLDKEMVSYLINLTDKQGQSYSLSVAAKFLDRTVNKVYIDTDVYGGERVGDLYSQFNGYYEMYDADAGSNRFVIDPIKESVLDIENRQYVLPESITVSFGNGDVETYDNVEWDLDGIEYSLQGRKGLDLRVAGYTSTFDDGTSRKIRFDYAKNQLVVTMIDENGNETSTSRYNNVPAAKVWNMTLDITDQTPQGVAVVHADGSSETIGTLGASGLYLEVSADKYTLNPYDTVFPSQYKVVFNDGTESGLITDGGWKLEAGANGSYKMKDIILGVAGDHNVMTEFYYLGYQIRVKFVADDIELEGLVEGEYYDGGTLYLVKGGGSVFEQLEQNYSYFYYNFSNIATKPDYRRIPLSFIDSDISSISTENENTYRNVKGVLGWDKKAYSGGMTMSPNIMFTISVIEPIMYATLDGETNHYVSLDYIGMPYDANFQKKNDVDEPEIAEYMIKTDNSGAEMKFLIDKTTIEYDVLGKTVTFECKFAMTSSFAKLGADAEGGTDISFVVTLPLAGYLYTSVKSAEFDRTPIKDGKGADRWRWSDIDEDSPTYRDGIIWSLGHELKASYLPKAIAADGTEVGMLWDLTDININASSEETGAGYYVAKGYYFNSDGVWTCKELAIYVEKYDATEQITEALGGSTTLVHSYDGNYYELPLDITADNMLMLREDGKYAALSAEAFRIEYKEASEDDRRYSVTDYPLNAGEYDIRLTVTDSNVTVNGELVFRLIIKAVTINPNNVIFAGESSSTVIYTYDGQSKGLVVESGLPMVTVDNWFSTREEKQALLDEQLAEGYDELTAKSRAYNTLYNRVTPKTKEYLDETRDEMEKTTGLSNEDLNAAMFDSLTPGLVICEVEATVSYVYGDAVLSEAPTDVGTYTVSFTVKADSNNGNYVFNKDTVLSRIIVIVQPTVDYSIVSSELEYNGRYQNPYINGLHDADGNLPAGVTVSYKYSSGVGSGMQYYTDGIRNVGVYNCTIEIDGGNNYPSGSIANQQIIIAAKDLYIDIDGVTGKYLGEISSVDDKAVFVGLSGSDTASVFGTAVLHTEAKEYFIPGVYGIYLDGFVVAAGQSVYTETDMSDTIERNGRTYYRMYLKSADEEGSLYRNLNAAGEYVYAEVIAMVGTKNNPGNYRVFVAEQGDYTIAVDTTGEEKIFIVNDDEELAEALDSIKEGDKAKLYLNASSGTKTVYSAINLDKNAVISLIGCYDEDKNILTYIDAITVSRGAVTLKIIAVEAEAEGDVAVTIGRKASAVTIEECLLTSTDADYTVGIRTDAGYSAKLLCVDTEINGFRTGMMIYGGDMEIVECTFAGNVFGVQSISAGNDIRFENNSFVGNITGLYFESETINVFNNYFSANRIAIATPVGDEVNLSDLNEFDGTNGTDVQIG